ncbi:MAG: diphthine--ammonia ligase [Elusimicrobiota bacterium]|nr:diphthine--ammonia ligase [Elusimicrobiota bacterium]
MKRRLKTFCCWSGGKESALSLYRVMQNKDITIECLVNMISEDGKHSRTHGVSSNLLKLQADSIGIPIIQRKTTWKNYEQEFKKVISELKKENISYGIFGDIDLQEHRDWVERVCKETGIKPILPLWKEERKELLKEFIGAGFKAIIVATNSKFLSSEWLGREINEKFIADLKSLDNIDLCGEKGEYHTYVHSGPIFKKPLKITRGEKMLRDDHWFLEIEVTI